VRQLRHPQAPEREGLAGQEPPRALALHPDQRVLAEHGRDLLRHHHPPSHRRGTFHSVADLEAAIATYIDGWNDRAHPFTWTKGADEIIAHAKPSPHRKKTYSTQH
jgi:hypothetical protein